LHLARIEAFEAMLAQQNFQERTQRVNASAAGLTLNCQHENRTLLGAMPAAGDHDSPHFCRIVRSDSCSAALKTQLRHGRLKTYAAQKHCLFLG
jgi:hypothetical protein